MKIEKSVDMPSRRIRGGTKYPWPDMEIGDSVFFDNEPAGSQSNPSVSSKIWAMRNQVKFASRREGNGVRIWRIK